MILNRFPLAYRSSAWWWYESFAIKWYIIQYWNKLLSGVWIIVLTSANMQTSLSRLRIDQCWLIKPLKYQNSIHLIFSLTAKLWNIQYLSVSKLWKYIFSIAICYLSIWQVRTYGFPILELHVYWHYRYVICNNDLSMCVTTVTHVWLMTLMLSRSCLLHH